MWYLSWCHFWPYLPTQLFFLLIHLETHLASLLCNLSDMSIFTLPFCYWRLNRNNHNFASTVLRRGFILKSPPRTSELSDAALSVSVSPNEWKAQGPWPILKAEPSSLQLSRRFDPPHGPSSGGWGVVWMTAERISPRSAAEDACGYMENSGKGVALILCVMCDRYRRDSVLRRDMCSVADDPRCGFVYFWWVFTQPLRCDWSGYVLRCVQQNSNLSAK